MVSKLKKMQLYVPSLIKPYTNPGIRGLLYSWAGEDDLVVQAINDAKEQIYVATAQAHYLNWLGSNVGVFRPSEFNLSDVLFRRLIPALSFAPKQVLPSVKDVLDIFFGENNPKVFVAEVRPNQIEIQIPSSVPALRRSLAGSHHFHNYSGIIDSIDNVAKELVISLDGDDKELKEDELANAMIAQGLHFEIIVSNTVGDNSVQFGAGADLSLFTAGERFMMAGINNYPGSFITDPSAPVVVTKYRGILGQSITAGVVTPNLTMTDASGIPDEPGLLMFNYGKPNQEILIKYYGRPNNSTILIDPSYNFLFDHTSGELVNVIKTPNPKPDKYGSDYKVYLVGVTAARVLAQRIIESIIAAGVVINWTIISPEIKC